MIMGTESNLYALKSGKHIYALQSQLIAFDIDYPDSVKTENLKYYPDYEIVGIERDDLLSMLWHNQDSHFKNEEYSQTLIKFVTQKPVDERFLLVDEFYDEAFERLGHKSTYVEYDSLGD